MRSPHHSRDRLAGRLVWMTFGRVRLEKLRNLVIAALDLLVDDFVEREATTGQLERGVMMGRRLANQGSLRFLNLLIS